MPTAQPAKLHEPLWPPLAAVIVAVTLHYALPQSMRFGPPWLGAGVMLALAAVAFYAASTDRRVLNQRVGYVIVVLLTGAVINGVARLMLGVLDKSQPPLVLFRSALILWPPNVITFALWYWRLDAGGPFVRAHRPGRHDGAFLFPQMAFPGRQDEQWRPHFIDYLFVSFNTSTAFSPTDVPVLSRWAKVVTMIEAIVSLGTVLVLVARAINTL
jgi:hypothetical protein